MPHPLEHTHTHTRAREMGTGNKEQGLGTWQETASEGGYYITGAPHVNLVVNSMCECVFECAGALVWVWLRLWVCGLAQMNMRWRWRCYCYCYCQLMLALLLFAPVKKVHFRRFSLNLELLVFASIFPLLHFFMRWKTFYFLCKKILYKCFGFIFFIVLIVFIGFLKICCWNALLTLLKFF